MRKIAKDGGIECKREHVVFGRKTTCGDGNLRRVYGQYGDKCFNKSRTFSPILTMRIKNQVYTESFLIDDIISMFNI